MKNKFNTWYTEEVQRELKNGTSIEDIGLKFLLTIIKPLHVNQIIQLYNELLSEKGKKVIDGGQVKFGIFDAIMLESKYLPSLDPFEELKPLDAECTLIDIPHAESTRKYENQHEMPESDECSFEWEITDDDIDRNAFDE